MKKNHLVMTILNARGSNHGEHAHECKGAGCVE